MVELTTNPIEHESITQRVRSNDAGAVVTFLGTVREFTGERRTTSLDYEAYAPMAQQKMEEVEREARERWPIIHAVLVHRVGHMELGDISVGIAVSCPHRHQAFDACRHIIDRVKEIVPIWKCEHWSSGESEWVHPGLSSGSMAGLEKK
jgi:molybdopterin synthase catalytic subunit